MKSAPEMASSSQSHHSVSEKTTELKKGSRKPLKEKPVPFNNPFADIFRKR